MRHAQASFHAADYDCLSPLGEQQSRWLGEHFLARGITFDAVVFDYGDGRVLDELARGDLRRNLLTNSQAGRRRRASPRS